MGHFMENEKGMPEQLERLGHRKIPLPLIFQYGALEFLQSNYFNSLVTWPKD